MKKKQNYVDDDDAVDISYDNLSLNMEEAYYYESKR